jgi:beta-lactamase class A
MTLHDDVAAAVAGQPGRFGIYARNLDTDETIAINADAVMPAESAAKTFVLLYYFQQVDKGVVDPMARVRLDADNRFIGTGVLRYLRDGIEPTLDDLAWLMIVVSDNTATAMLMQSVGAPADVNAAMRELGYPSANLNESITLETAMAGEPFSTSTPHDLAEVYAHLDERGRTILYRQQHLIGLPRRLPHMSFASDVGITMPVRVFNKTGNGAGTFVDSGLFETDHASWVVAAMASEQTDFAARPDDVAPAAFGEVGDILYRAWGGNEPAPRP